MARKGESGKKMANNGANVGFEEKLWKPADKLRSNMDAAEYKHVVLGLIFLKYISDSFEDMHIRIITGCLNPCSTPILFKGGFDASNIELGIDN